MELHMIMREMEELSPYLLIKMDLRFQLNA